RLAVFKKTEAVVVFQSGFAANAGTVAAVLNKDDVVVSDELNHASIIDGCRLSRAAIRVFPHKNVGAARTVLGELPRNQRKLQIIERLWENTKFFKAGLRTLGFDTGLSESPITPVIVGEGALAMKLSDRLFAEGVFAQGIAFPTVARDKARVRTIVTATHTRDELRFALDVFARVGRELGII